MRARQRAYPVPAKDRLLQWAVVHRPRKRCECDNLAVEADADGVQLLRVSGHMNSDHPKMPSDRQSGDAVKRLYVKPAFRHEQVFETMALACGKISTTQLQCRSLRKAS